ncbi:pantoate--beta-alanine ligase [Phaeovibrio sulfidiphilus]|uniref:Pantothenate synthetase n=1 Tax=Phaeovibrio sulfidiphilus TaxID=1220600 RepID=A0A8J6YUN3_9PROT|nr:pantoate--beta-alanine ligase [Phaeovibrio sulfidiphilus]MBE1236072.1 pantoate--beta-alanine ligase [Phaeovibrio sulfidiphilus]
MTNAQNETSGSSRPTSDLEVVHDTAALRRKTMAWRAQRLKVALVPTMGALHEGHLALVRMALEQADKVVVSVFVNPTQFGPGEDFERYPRSLEDDAKKLREVGASMLYAPSVEDMYPEGYATNVTVEGVSRGLCGDRRPGHFRGVATVVTKLLIRVMPDIAIFGEKDYQQLLVIRRLARDLDIPARIVPAPTQRDASGLALSSRNQYLTDEEREIAPLFYRSLVNISKCMMSDVEREKCGIQTRGLQKCIDCAKIALSNAGFTAIDYMELRDADTFEPVTEVDPSRPARLLGAVYLGQTRLIDNVTVPFTGDDSVAPWCGCCSH